MKALKYLAGITLATIGVVFTVGPVVDVFNPQSEWYWWMNAGMFVVLGLLPLAGAVALLKRSATEIPPRRCPRCGRPEQAPAEVLESSWDSPVTRKTRRADASKYSLTTSQ
jgi:Na+/melibiose symporter-like transporter